MADLEMTKLCAEAMGAVEMQMCPPNHKQLDFKLANGVWVCNFDPLYNDAQCFALAKKLQMSMSGGDGSCEAVWFDPDDINNEIRVERDDDDLNRAIVECVAKMQSAKGG